MHAPIAPQPRPGPRFRSSPGWLLLALALLACEQDEGSAKPAGGDAPTPEHAGQQAAGPAKSPIGEGTSAGEPSATPGPPAPELGCRVQGQVVLGDNLGAARVVAYDDALWVASYARRQGKRSLARFRVARDLQVRALPALPLGDATEAPARVPPAIAAGHGLWVAAVDGRGSLALWPDAEEDAPEPVAVAQHTDLRFLPALHELRPGRALVAYTEGDATGMRVQATVWDDEIVKRHAITPLSHGASAPRFLVGAATPSLLMIDARSGMSPLLRVPFERDGTPAEAVVERPVNLPYAPTSLAGVQLEDGPAHVAYTAIGNGATAAVGLVPLGATDPPIALLRGSGYALLSVDVTRGRRHAAFAVDAPVHEKPNPPLEVQVRVWNGRQLGDPLHLGGENEGESRARPALAYDRDTDSVALVSVRDGKLELHTLRCDL